MAKPKPHRKPYTVPAIVTEPGACLWQWNPYLGSVRLFLADGDERAKGASVEAGTKWVEDNRAAAADPTRRSIGYCAVNGRLLRFDVRPGAGGGSSIVLQNGSTYADHVCETHTFGTLAWFIWRAEIVWLEATDRKRLPDPRELVWWIVADKHRREPFGAEPITIGLLEYLLDLARRDELPPGLIVDDLLHPATAARRGELLETLRLERPAPKPLAAVGGERTPPDHAGMLYLYLHELAGMTYPEIMRLFEPRNAPTNDHERYKYEAHEKRIIARGKAARRYLIKSRRGDLIGRRATRIAGRVFGGQKPTPGTAA